MTNQSKDRHVLAAAVTGRATTLLTFNVGDFPDETVSPFDIDVVLPDELLLDLLDRTPRSFVHALETQIAGYRRPTMSLRDLAQALGRAGCLETAEQILRRFG